MIDNSKELERWRADNPDNELLYDHPLNENSLVWEIGAYHGGWVLKILAKYGCTIVAFEPQWDNYDVLNEMLSGTNVRYYNVALGGQERKELLTNEGDASSLCPRLNATGHEVFVDDIRNWGFDIGQAVDLMNINVEGMEYEILFSLLCNDLIHLVKRIQVQFHPWVKNAEIKRGILRKWLSETHDEVYCYDWVWECFELKK
jgi:FkbM family methyltransferase